MTTETIEAIGQFKNNAERVRQFTNEKGSYITEGGSVVETLPSFMERQDSNLRARYPGDTFKGDFVAATNYQKNDVVRSTDGLAYLCILSNNASGVLPQNDGAHWRIWQGVTFPDLAASTGADLIGNNGETVGDSLDALQLPSYVALRTYAGPRKCVYVTGYLVTTKPFGITGMFIRDDSDTTTADNGGTIIVSNSGVRWKRAYGGEIVRVEWFDGDVGKPAATNSAALSAAFAVSKQVAIPKGTFDYDTTLQLNGGCMLYGAGSNESTFNYTGAGDAVIVTNGGNKMRNLAVKSAGASGIHLTGAPRNFFDDVYVIGGPAIGWWLQSTSTAAQVDWNIFTDCGATAVLPVKLDASGDGAVNANEWTGGIWRTTATSGGIVCKLTSGGFGCGGNIWRGGDWSGYSGNTSFEVGDVGATGGTSQNTWEAVFIDTGTDKGFVLNSGSSSNRILGGVIQANSPVVQNNVANGNSGTDTILISSLVYLPIIRQPDWTPATFQNGWTNFSASEAQAGYYKDSLGIVHVRGHVKGGDATVGKTIFVLPAGYIPKQNMTFAQVYSNAGVGAFAAVTVAVNGAIYVQASPGNAFLTVNLSFRAEQ